MTRLVGDQSRGKSKSVLNRNTIARAIVDFDQLAAKEGIKWVFSGASRLYPDFSRCLLSMSPDGGDASEMREFDIETRSSVEGGFRAPASKSNFGWLDKDTVVVSAAFEEADKTQSGYPRVVKLWKRGTRLEDATPIFEAQKQDLAAGGRLAENFGQGLRSVRVRHEIGAKVKSREGLRGHGADRREFEVAD